MDKFQFDKYVTAYYKAGRLISAGYKAEDVRAYITPFRIIFKFKVIQKKSGDINVKRIGFVITLTNHESILDYYAPCRAHKYCMTKTVG